MLLCITYEKTTRTIDDLRLDIFNLERGQEVVSKKDKEMIKQYKKSLQIQVASREKQVNFEQLR